MIKILFVDDDKNLTDGMARMLRKKKDEWEMTFVNSVHEAMNHLDNNVCDVIVTDYKMPDMDGIQLLKLVKDKHAGIRRIILSGQLRPEIYDEAVKVSHSYVSKPCDPEGLITAIEEHDNDRLTQSR